MIESEILSLEKELLNPDIRKDKNRIKGTIKKS